MIRDVHVRPAVFADIERIVTIHVAAFGESFLTMLGHGFLRELYIAFVRGRDGICFVGEAGGTVIGFVAGTTAPHTFFKRLLQSRWHVFVFSSLAALVRHPLTVIPKLIRAIWYRGEEPHGAPRGVLLSSIAVSPSHVGRGVGKLLVETFCDAALAAGGKFVYLTTDRDDNEKTHAFYRGAGFGVESTFLKDTNRWMQRYIRPVAR